MHLHPLFPKRRLSPPSDTCCTAWTRKNPPNLDEHSTSRGMLASPSFHSPILAKAEECRVA